MTKTKNLKCSFAYDLYIFQYFEIHSTSSVGSDIISFLVFIITSIYTIVNKKKVFKKISRRQSSFAGIVLFLLMTPRSAILIDQD